MVKICAISDLHGTLPEIGQCDVLFICGDTFPLNIQINPEKCQKWLTNEFSEWAKNVPCKTIYFIAGNHDFALEIWGYDKTMEILEEIPGLHGKVIYVQDGLIEIEGGLTLYGCPWCTGPRGWAFVDVFATHYDSIPDCDILLTHQPPSVNKLGCSYPGTWQEECYGSYELKDVIKERKIRYNFCGHIHTGTHGGEGLIGCETEFYNVSLLDEDYKVAYEPLYLDISEEVIETSTTIFNNEKEQ